MRQIMIITALLALAAYPMKNDALTLQRPFRRVKPQRIAISPTTKTKQLKQQQQRSNSLFFRPKMTSSSSETMSSSRFDYYTTPSIFTPNDSRPIVLFDGNCNLCSWGVQLILDNDRASEDSRGNLRVAALQSRVGTLLLDRMPLHVREQVLASSSSDGEEEDGEKYKSIVVCSKSKTFLNSNAVLRIGRALKFPFRPLALLAYIVPTFIRDFVYGIISRNRKKWFGSRAECRLWDDNWDIRFVDDDILGGEGSGNSDPFADPNAPKAASSKEEAIVEVGDDVRIISEEPIVLRHLDSHPEGLCVSGCVGTVVKKDGSKEITVEFDEEKLLGNHDNDKQTTFQVDIAKGNFVKV